MLLYISIGFLLLTFCQEVVRIVGGIMLSIHVGPLVRQIRDVSAYFDSVYEVEWFEDDFVKRICKEIDDTDVYSAYQMNNPIWGPTNCSLLSTSAKNLILAYKTNEIIYATCMGDNCSSLLLEIAEHKDLTIVLEHILRFNRDFIAHFLNNNVTVTTNKDYVFTMLDLLDAIRRTMSVRDIKEVGRVEGMTTE